MAGRAGKHSPAVGRDGVEGAAPVTRTSPSAHPPARAVFDRPGSVVSPPWAIRPRKPGPDSLVPGPWRHSSLASGRGSIEVSLRRSLKWPGGVRWTVPCSPWWADCSCCPWPPGCSAWASRPVFARGGLIDWRRALGPAAVTTAFVPPRSVAGARDRPRRDLGGVPGTSAPAQLRRRKEGSTVNCYDCAQESQTTVATAVCRHCGAAVCTEHAHVTAELVHRTVGMGPSVRPLAARHITCTICYDAEHSGNPTAAAAAPPPPPPDRPARGRR
ncbi:DUF2180 family protein [Streptomyces sp. MNU76]|uniref:DUF2180 family protein n=1 Tax=Streptomyces sp. MNU76 TaxID=2560026 RepID=UPI001E6065EB|nr:DUF2180 family protein [Streptomyces sp. MNU76]MCC9706590.1 DUF2180 family protein [Streptomyces sp. MNU76]